MNQEIKEQWCEALESGKYKQGFGSLRLDNDTYCCLGVLTDLYIKAHEGEDWQPAGTRYDINLGVYAYNGEANVLHYSVAAWAGLTGFDDPFIYTTNTEPDTLSELNDGRPEESIQPLSFPEIAKLIREQL